MLMATGKLDALPEAISAEMHFWRLEPEIWGKCLDRIKEMGIGAVASYLSWRRHSPEEGIYDFDGTIDPKLNLRYFLTLCQERDLSVYLKPGPWICAEETNGGYPDWLIKREYLLAMGPDEKPILAYNPPLRHRIPSYLHPDYLTQARTWLTKVIEVILPFTTPDGPVAMIQLDNEPSMAFKDGLFEADYNPVISGKDGLFQKWLQKKYADLGELNSTYRAAYGSFKDVIPPKTFEPGKAKARYLDWAEFKEWILAEHIRELKKVFAAQGLGHLLFTVNLNEHRQLDIPNHWEKLKKASGFGGYDIYAVPPIDIDSHIRLSLAIRYATAIFENAWSPEIMAGVWMLRGEQDYSRELSEDFFEFIYLAALANGLKGFNFYMFVDRDNWALAPVNNRGEKGFCWNVARRVVELIKNKIPDFVGLKPISKMGILYYRPHAIEEHIERWVLPEKHLNLKYTTFVAAYQYLLLNCWNPNVITLESGNNDLSNQDVLVVIDYQSLDELSIKKLSTFEENGGKIIKIDPPQNESGFSETVSQTLAVKIKKLGLNPVVETDHPMVYCTMWADQNNHYLFLVNLAQEPLQIAVTFYSCLIGFQDLLTGEVYQIKDHITIKSHSVRVFKLF